MLLLYPQQPHPGFVRRLRRPRPRPMPTPPAVTRDACAPEACRWIPAGFPQKAASVALQVARVTRQAAATPPKGACDALCAAVDALFATTASLFATRLARHDPGFLSACADLLAFYDSVAAAGGGLVAFRDTARAFCGKSCVKVGRERRMACQRSGLGFDGRPCARWRMGKKAAKCYKTGHTRRGWRDLRHVTKQKRPAQGEQRNKQGEARCATGTCGMGLGWGRDRSGLWRCVSGALKRRSMWLPCRLAMASSTYGRLMCDEGLDLANTCVISTYT